MQDSVANCFQTSCQWLILSGPRRETSRVHGVLDVKQLSLEFIFLFVLRHLSRLESFGLFEAELGNFEMDILTDQRVSKTLDSKISEMWFRFLYWCIEYLLIYEWFIVICQYLRDTTNMRTQQISTSKDIYLSPSFDSHLFWSWNVYVEHLHLFHLCLWYHLHEVSAGPGECHGSSLGSWPWYGDLRFHGFTGSLQGWFKIRRWIVFVLWQYFIQYLELDE